MPNNDTINAINERLNEKNLNIKLNFLSINITEEKSYFQQLYDRRTKNTKMDIIFSSLPDSSSDSLYSSSYYKLADSSFFEPLTNYMKSELGNEMVSIFPEKHWDALLINSKINTIISDFYENLLDSKTRLEEIDNMVTQLRQDLEKNGLSDLVDMIQQQYDEW